MSLFVGNISPSTSKKALISYFGKFGQCEVEFYRRFAYVNYSKESDGKNALNACNNQELDGSRLKVEFSQRKPVNQSPPSDKEPGVDQYRVKISSDKEEELQVPKGNILVFSDKTPPNTPVDQAMQGLNEGIQEEVFEKVQGKVYLMRDLAGEIKPSNENFIESFDEEIEEVQLDKGQVEGVERNEEFVSGEIILTVSIDEPGKFEEGKMEIEVEKSEEKEVKMEEIKENQEDRVEEKEKYMEVEEKVKEDSLGNENKAKAEDVEIKLKDENEEVKKIEKNEELNKSINRGNDVVEKIKKNDSKASSKNESPVSKLSRIKPVVPFYDPLTVQTPEPEKRRPSLLMGLSRSSPGSSKIENKTPPKEEPVIQVLPVQSRPEKTPRKVQKVGEGARKIVKTKENKEELTKKNDETELKIEETKQNTGQVSKVNKKKVSASRVNKKTPETENVIAEATQKEIITPENPDSKTENTKDSQESKIKLPKPEETKPQPTPRTTRSSSRTAPQPSLPSIEASLIKENPLMQTPLPSVKFVDPNLPIQPAPKLPQKKNPIPELSPPIQTKNSSKLPLDALKFDYEALDDITISIHKTAFEVKKQLKDFSNSLLKCKVCNKEIKAKSAESHLQSKFHKDSS